MVAITGASGAAYGVRILELLHTAPDVETHLVVTSSGALTLRQELDRDLDSLTPLVDVLHRPGNIGATIASGSFTTVGMVVAPCSIKTLSAVASSYSDGLASRAADVTLKEGRPLVLLVRESPLHLGHLRLMTQAAEAGAVIAPPVPAFYARPQTVEDIVDHTARRALARLGLDDLAAPEWPGLVADRISRNGVAPAGGPR